MLPAKTLTGIDWSHWRPRDVATLTLIACGERVLLMRKKRGLGAGKIIAPGGRLEPGEKLEDCAVREVQEELCVTPLAPRWCGENLFQFTDGYSVHVHVYRSDALAGEPTETDEGAPLWVPRSEIPYGQMWEDDVLWVPHLLAGRHFSGRYLFEGDRMLEYALELDPLAAASVARS